MSKILLSTAALLLMGTAAFAGPTPHKIAAKTPAKTAVLVCPVTGDKIASIKDAAGHSTYKGKTYYFCCAACKPEFDKNPAKYIKQASAMSHKPMSHKM